MVPTFRNWLKLKEVADATTQTKVLGAAVDATQPQNPANVADRLAATNAPLALAISSNPRLEKIKALADAKTKAKNPQLQNTNVVPPNVGASMNPGST